MKTRLVLCVWITYLAILLGGCGGGGASGGPSIPPPAIDPASIQKSGGGVGHTIAEIARIAKGSLLLQGKIRPGAYPSSNLATNNTKAITASPTNSPCPSISTPSAPSSNFIIVIDYGAGCVDSFDGIRRSGAITITVTNAIFDSANNLASGSIVLAFTSFSRDQSTLGGSATIHVTAPTSESWDMSLTLSDPNETQALVFKTIVTYTDSTDIETVNGSGTFVSNTDGSFDFTLENLQYDFETTHTPLICPDPIGGSISLVTPSHKAALIFGDPNPGCGSALLSIDGGENILIVLDKIPSSPPPSDSTPSAPGGVSAAPDINVITVSWNPVEGATSYNLYRASQSGITKTNYAALPRGEGYTGVASPYVVRDLPAPISTTPDTYYFVVTSVNANGESAESAEVSAALDPIWVSRSSSAGNSLYSVASSGSDVVAVGALGTIVTSPDGISWITRSSKITTHLYGVASSGTQFVAVGDLGTILTSSDLATWTPRVSGTTARLRAAAWTGAQFIAVGDSGTILTSPNAISWTKQASGTLNDLYGVTSNPSQFVIVGASGTILTSSDGAIWTPRNSQGGSALRGVVWSGTQFLIAGDGLQTSFDGITWVRQGGAWGNTMNSVVWSGNRFMAAGTFGTTQTSADGIAWTGTPFLSSWDLTGVTWFKDQFIVVGLNGAIFTSAIVPAEANSLYAIASSETQAVTVGALGTILTSSDGISWTTRSSNITTHLYGVASGGSQFIAVGDLGTILTSSDLVTWTKQTSGTSTRLRGITWTGSEYIAVGDSGAILTSPNSTSWTPQISGTINDLYGVTSNSSEIITVGAGGIILTSPNGAAWTQRTSQGGNILHGVVWSGTQFLVVGDVGPNNMQTSFDGITWVTARASLGNAINSAVWSGTRFMTVGTAGTIQTSVDGIAWTGTFFLSSWDLTGVTWFKNRFIVVGLNGTIIPAP